MVYLKKLLRCTRKVPRSLGRMPFRETSGYSIGRIPAISFFTHVIE